MNRIFHQPELGGFSYLIITANAALSIQSCTLSRKHEWFHSHIHTANHFFVNPLVIVVAVWLVTCLQAVQNFL